MSSTLLVDGVDQADTQPAAERRGVLGLLFGPGKSYFVLAIIAAVVAMVATLVLLSSLTDRVTYYVLGQDVAANTEVTPSMLVPVEVNAGGEPVNYLTPGELVDSSGRVKVARVALQAGDPVTSSVVGVPSRIGSEFPDDFSVVSFAADASLAVAGQVRAGDLVDIVAVQSGGRSSVVLHKVPVVDVASEPGTVSSSVGVDDVTEGPNSVSRQTGVPQVYTVALVPDDVVRLASVSDLPLMVALVSPDAPDSVSASTSQESTLNRSTVGRSAPTADEATPQP